MPSVRILILAASLPVTALGQGATANAPTDGRRLRPFTTNGMVYAVRGTDTVPAGSYASQLMIYDDHFVSVSTSRTRVFGTVLDTVISHLPDFQPLSYYESSKAGVGRVEFRGTQITGTYTKPDGTSTPISLARPLTAISQPTLPFLVAAADLRDELAFTVLAFNPLVDSSTFTFEVRVTGREVLRGDTCWMVRIAIDTGGGHIWPQSTTWIDAVTRIPRRTEIPLAVNASLVFEAARDVRHEDRSR